MNITFDAAKDASNRVKHGVSLAEAVNIEWDTVWARSDQRRDYDEPRVIGVGYIGLRMFCVVFTDRGDQRRIISLRKANSREVQDYAKA